MGYVVVLASLLAKLLVYSGACSKDHVQTVGEGGEEEGGGGEDEFVASNGWFLVQVRMCERRERVDARAHTNNTHTHKYTHVG